ncbi:hypothetical protein [Vibrio parahaemolyticus]|uniref:hypothetical protein n=1 Tax=Vibrio parahaemolyticus TaxID=670 RepID=UPI002F7A5549
MGYYKVPEKISKKGLWRVYRKINGVVHQSYYHCKNEAKSEDERLAKLQKEAKGRLSILGWGEIGLRYVSVSFSRTGRSNKYTAVIRVQKSKDSNGDHFNKDFPIFELGPDEAFRMAGEALIEMLSLSKRKEAERELIKAIRLEVKKEHHIKFIWSQLMKTDCELTYHHKTFKPNGAPRRIRLEVKKRGYDEVTCSLIGEGRDPKTNKLHRRSLSLLDREFYLTLADVTAFRLRTSGLKPKDEKFWQILNNTYFATAPELLHKALSHHSVWVDQTNIFGFQQLVLGYSGH